MTLLELLQTCNHNVNIRIHFGEDKYFDIDGEQKDAFTKWLDWMGIYDTVEDYYEGDIVSWNVQDITFTEWDKEGKRSDNIKHVLFIKML